MAEHKIDDPIALKPPIRFWSASALKDFEQCPYRLWLGRVMKEAKPEIGDDPKHPLTRGIRVHEEAEKFVRGEGPLTHDLRKLRTEFEELAEQYQNGLVTCEDDWWFDRQWQPAEKFQGWGVVKLDAFVEFPNFTAKVIDYKTGKSMGKEVMHQQQGLAYTIEAFARYPQLTTVQVEFWFTDEGKVKSKRYVRTQIDVLRERFEKRANKLTNAVAFPPKPNRNNCRYCSYSGNNGGTGVCPFWVDTTA